MLVFITLKMIEWGGGGGWGLSKLRCGNGGLSEKNIK